MPTDNQQYIDACQRTLSNQFHGEKVNGNNFLAIGNELIQYGQKLDLIKKALFYGKSNVAYGIDNCNELMSDVNKDIVHGIVGKVTESIELLEALIKAIEFGKELDLVNIKEEVGDGFWYDAILAKACGFTFEEAQQANIEKLKERYPQKFTSECAENRDLEKERKILEK